MRNKVYVDKFSWKATFRKPCKECDGLYLPSGRSSKFCDSCIGKRLKKRIKVNREILRRNNGKK